MMNLLDVFLSMIVLFFIFLLIMPFLKKLLKNEICSLCASIFLSWAAFLILYWKGEFSDKVILAILIGQSTLGIFYFLDSKKINGVGIFQLPFILTLILIGYILIEGFSGTAKTFYVLAGLWITFIVIYAFRDKGKIGKVTRKLVECCKKW